MVKELRCPNIYGDYGTFFPAQVANCAAGPTTETRDMTISINLDGSLKHAFRVPNCGSGRIQLMSYQYCQTECSFSQCQSTFKTNFSSEAAFLFHERCSMQRECTNLSFPSRTTLQKNQTNAVCVKYQCLGKFLFSSNVERCISQ